MRYLEPSIISLSARLAPAKSRANMQYAIWAILNLWKNKHCISQKYIGTFAFLIVPGPLKQENVKKDICKYFIFHNKDDRKTIFIQSG